MDVTKTSLKKTLVEYRKKTLYKEEKCFFITSRKYCILENFASLLGKVWEIFHFQNLQVPTWNIRSILSLSLESSISRNIRQFFSVGFFLFS